MPANILPILSDIIIKLLSKNAEDRYQRTFGLKHDLQKCLDFLVGWSEQSETQQSPFPLSLDLQQAFPETKGFSVRNLK
ncbi:hypothetical protein WDW89_14405 [Deltaproteobacteria bacterium TL4]